MDGRFSGAAVAMARIAGDIGCIRCAVALVGESDKFDRDLPALLRAASIIL